jgi:hypothetical protein
VSKFLCCLSSREIHKNPFGCNHGPTRYANQTHAVKVDFMIPYQMLKLFTAQYKNRAM